MLKVEENPNKKAKKKTDSKSNKTVQVVDIDFKNGPAHSFTGSMAVHVSSAYTFIPQSWANALGLVSTGSVDLSITDPMMIAILQTEGALNTTQTVFATAQLPTFSTGIGPDQSDQVFIMDDANSDFGIYGQNFLTNYGYNTASDASNTDTLIYIAGTRDVSGSVMLEGPTDYTDNLTIQLRHSNGNVSFDYPYMTDADGNFYLSNLPPDIYTVWIKGTKWLAKTVVVDATGGNVSGVTVALSGGDANNDNSVDSTDFGLLIGSFNSQASIPGSGYDPTTDFNSDGFVDSADFGILIGNFNTTGAP